MGPTDPISGGASAVLETLTTTMMGVADFPIATLKALAIHPDSGKGKGKGKAKDGDKNDSENSSTTALTTTDSSTSVDQSRSSTSSEVAALTPSTTPGTLTPTTSKGADSKEAATRHRPHQQEVLRLSRLGNAALVTA
jgi:hypothetical protein